MKKTQIQLTDELYRDLKQLARRKQWSLAEALRRGAEAMLERYAEPAQDESVDWLPPTSSNAGWRGLDAIQLRDLAREDESSAFASD